MKLNFDAVRKILLYVEENFEYQDADSDTPHIRTEISDGDLVLVEDFCDFDKSELSYALEQLIAEKFLSTSEKPFYINGNLSLAKINGLTWKGHELLDNIRNDTAWDISKKRMKSVGKVSISTVAKFAGVVAQALMADPNSINNLMEGVNNLTKML